MAVRRRQRALATGVSDPQAALIRGIVLGQDGEIDALVKEDSRASGLAHLLAGSWPERDTAWAMSQENVEVVRRMYERLLQGGDAAFDVLDPEFELHPDPAAEWVGVDDIFRGPDGVRSYMAQVYEAFEDYRPEVEEVLDAGDTVITLAIEHGRGRRSGATVEARRTAHVWTMRANKAVRLDLYLDRDEALSAARLSK